MAKKGMGKGSVCLSPAEQRVLRDFDKVIAKAKNRKKSTNKGVVWTKMMAKEAMRMDADLATVKELQKTEKGRAWLKKHNITYGEF